eukprot:scaffold294958_cov30-Tisochrysis_lutea.AAC.3
MVHNSLPSSASWARSLPSAQPEIITSPVKARQRGALTSDTCSSPFTATSVAEGGKQDLVHETALRARHEWEGLIGRAARIEEGERRDPALKLGFDCCCPTVVATVTHPNGN